jgi:hypothetical protein
MEIPHDGYSRDDLRDNSRPGGSGMKWAFGAVLIALFVAGGVGLAYLSRERAQLRDLTVANQTLNSSMTELRGRLQSMTAQLEEQAASARAAAAARITPGASVRPLRPSDRPSDDRARQAANLRLNQIQNRLAEHDKAIAGNRDDLVKARDELQANLNSTRDELSGSISSTHDELSGSIARTHDDIVALQKRGERDYFEFTLDKSKEFRRVGPVSLSLRKANPKRKSYDLAMFVDDNQLQKKGVNLFEPVWISMQDQSQPVQLVVNQIDKDKIQGYISAPKYKRSELGDALPAGPQPSSAAQPALKQQ